MVRFSSGKETAVLLRVIAPTPSDVPSTSFDNSRERLQCNIPENIGTEAEVDDEQAEFSSEPKSPCGFPVNPLPRPELCLLSRVTKLIDEYDTVPYY